MTSHKFPRQKRIRKRREYLACYSQGKKYHGSHFMLYCMPSPDMPAKVGIAVSRKVGNAIARNRVKRLLREVLRKQHLPRAQFVAVAKNTAAKLNFAQVDAELTRLLTAAQRAFAAI